MVDALVTWVAVLLWGVTLANLPRLRHPSAAGMWLWSTFCALALAATLFCPWAPSVLEALLGAGAGLLADPAARSLVLVAAFCAQSLLREITRPGHQRPRDSTAPPRRILAVAVTVSLLWVCFAVAVEQGGRHLGSFPQPGPWSTAYLLIFVVYLGYAVAEVMLGCLRYGRSASGPLARGLQLIAVGCALGLGYLLVKVLSAIMLFLGAPIPFTVEAALGRSLAIAAGALVAAGSSWPAVAKLAGETAHRGPSIGCIGVCIHCGRP